jgi:hypothetical protein
MPAFFGTNKRQRSRRPFSNPAGSKGPSGGIVQAAVGGVGANEGISFFPEASAFIPQTMDVLTGNNTLPPPGPTRYSALSIYLTGVWLEGHRTKVTAKDAYTHLLLADPTLTIYDSYNYQGRSQAADALAIPAGQTSNWWFVVFSFITNVPSFGRRLVIAADRYGTPGSWPTLV